MTGTVENLAPQVLTDFSHGNLQFGFTNGSGGKLSVGQEVIFKSDGTIDKRTTGTQKPLGIVVVESADATIKATVRVAFMSAGNGVAFGGTLNPGDYVKQNGTLNGDGYPQYVVCASGDYALAQVIKGGAVNASVVVGILNSPVKV